MHDIKNWLLGILGSLLLLGASWLVPAVISIQARQDLAEKVIPKPVEDSLREIREKTNGQAESCNKAQGTVSNNTTEISNLKERVTRLENRP